MMRRFLPSLFLLPLAGCAAEGPFPSLAPRPAEKLSMEEPERPAPVIPSDAGLAGQIGELLADARRGQNAFEAALPAARAAAGAARTSGSESWIEAQQVLSRLEAARAPTVTALAELDALSVKRAGLPTNAADLAALRQAIETAGALAQGQQEAIDGLRASLSPI